MSKSVAVLVYPGFQELEFWYPVLRLREAEMEVTVVGVTGDQAAYSRLGYPVVPDLALSAATAKTFAAIVVPGGNIRELSSDQALASFLAAAFRNGTILAGISEGKALLAAAQVDTGRGSVIVGESTDDLPAWARRLAASLQA